jgi:hypothetical protein
MPSHATKLFALSASQRRRLARLARDTGRAPEDAFRFVLRDGFEFCEWEARESRAADDDARKRSAVPNDEAQRRVRQLIDAADGRRSTRKAA